MIKAVLFDQDGVIIDSERDGHRIAYEMAFAHFGYDIKWDVDFYHELTQVGGGKERMLHYFQQYYVGTLPADLEAFVKALHAKKTDEFLSLLERIPLRPGVRRLMEEVNKARIPLGICTTSHERVALKIAQSRLQEIEFDLILAGDMVSRKKPHPEIYLTALEKLQIKPEECLVVEDSHVGLSAAKAAGCRVLVTYTDYTRKEDLSAADWIVNCLGDEWGERTEFARGSFPLEKEGVISLTDLMGAFPQSANY